MASSESRPSTSSSTETSEPPPPKDLTEIQTFRPTLEEFQDFAKFIDYMESQGAHHAGVARVIPPPEWHSREGNYDDCKGTIIMNPIRQCVEGQQGVFTVNTDFYRKEMTVKDYEELARNSKYRPPVFFDTEDIERKYWGCVGEKSKKPSPVYGAGTRGSLYDDEVNVWNINRLGSILDLLNTVYKKEIQGVNTSWLYFGMWKTSFCWHVEDMNLYSINYLHYGASKFWYAIPPKHGYRLENLAASYFPESHKLCPAFLRHKMTLISPTILRKKSIPVHKIEQRVGEFMVTFPGGYHAGFNLGYNCAESTNFATKRWIDYGKEAVLCTCPGEKSVRISMDAFVEKYQTAKQFDDWISKTSGVANDYDDDDYLPLAKLAGESKTNASTSTSSVSASRKSADESDSELNDPYRLGSWAKPLENLWTFKIFDMQAEREYNRRTALTEPHCCLCQYFVSRTLARNSEAVPTGKSVRRLVTEMCFYKTGDNPASMAEETGADTTSDLLLTCANCEVTVHASCYSGNRAMTEQLASMTSEGSWQCDRCKAGAALAECALCCLRGGAMKPTIDVEWAHMICTVVTPGASYTDPVTRRSIDLRKLSTANAAVCKFCHSNVGYPIMCTYPSCNNTYHVTCGFHAGVAFEIKDWPTVMASVCPDHNLGANGLKNISVKDEVYARRSEDENYTKGRVYSTTNEIYCVVDFDDGSFSNNLYPRAIESCRIVNIIYN